MQEIDDVVVFESPSLQASGVDVYDTLGTWARKRAMATVKVVEVANFIACLLVSGSIELFQHNDMLREPNGEDIERLVCNGLEIFMSLVEKETGPAQDWGTQYM